MTWYTGDPTYDGVLTAGLVFAALVLLVGPFVQSPYGRFASERFGVALDPRLGWFLMELPATLSFLWFFFDGPRCFEPVPLVFLGIWLVHYGNRGWFFPWSIRSPRGARASFSLMVMVTGWFVTTTHGYLHASFFSRFGGHYDLGWFDDPRFRIGFVIYAGSLALNIHSDAIIRRLRRHHAIHHAPFLMQRFNFNVTVPLWDVVRRTVYHGPLPPGVDPDGDAVETRINGARDKS